MTQSHVPAPQATERKPTSEGPAREQLHNLYHAIGISAVAAAAAQMARAEVKPAKPKHEMPACLRDDDDDHLAA
jgi:hypothetical protein